MTPPANRAWPGAPYPLGATWDGQGMGGIVSVVGRSLLLPRACSARE
jgi:hypothetical protein